MFKFVTLETMKNEVQQHFYCNKNKLYEYSKPFCLSMASTHIKINISWAKKFTIYEE